MANAPFGLIYTSAHYGEDLFLTLPHYIGQQTTDTKQNDKSTATEHFSVAYYLFSFITNT